MSSERIREMFNACRRTRLETMDHGAPGLDYSDYLETEAQDATVEKFQKRFSACLFKLRKLVVFIAVVLYAVYAYGASRIPAQNRMDDVLKESHPIQQAYLWQELEMWRNPSMSLFYTFGLEERLWLDPAQNRWAAQSEGQVLLDPEFDMAKHQMALAEFCDILGREQGFHGVDCRLNQFHDWARRKKVPVPVPEAQFHSLLAQFCFETESFTHRRIGFHNGKAVAYIIGLVYEGEYQIDQMNRSATLQLEARLRGIVEDFNAKTPKGANKGFFTGYEEWPWLATRGAMISNAMGGIALGMTTSLIVLILMSGNIILSIISVLCIGLIIL